MISKKEFNNKEVVGKVTLKLNKDIVKINKD